MRWALAYDIRTFEQKMHTPIKMRCTRTLCGQQFSRYRNLADLAIFTKKRAILAIPVVARHIVDMKHYIENAYSG